MEFQLSKLVDQLQMAPHADISKLPNDILLSIFNQLDHDDMLKCTLVCKRFNEIISPSDEFLSITGLQVNNFDPSVKFDVPITRNYRRVIICLKEFDDFTASDRQVLKFANSLINIGVHINELCLCHIPGRFDVKVCQLIAQCKNVQLLSMTDVFESKDMFTEDQYPKLKSIKLAQLRTLHASDSSDWFIKFIDCSELDTFSIVHAPRKHTVDLLNNLTRCDKIVLDHPGNIEFSIEPKFKWNSLTIVTHNGCVMKFNDEPEKFKNLAEAAAPNAELEMTNCKLYPKLLAFMMTSVVNVKFLFVRVDGIDSKFVGDLQRELVNAGPIQNIRQFEFEDTKLSEDLVVLETGCMDWFFKLFPNVRYFYITANLMQILNAATVPELFAEVIHFGITSRMAKIAKLDQLRFPRIGWYSIVSENLPRQERDRSLEDFVRENPSLELITKLHGAEPKRIYFVRDGEMQRPRRVVNRSN